MPNRLSDIPALSPRAGEPIPETVARRPARSSLIALILIVVFVVGALGLLSSARSGGHSRLRALLDAHAKAGLGASLKDLGVAVPVGLDVKRQKAAWTWMLASRRTDTLLQDCSWFVRGESPPKQLLTWYEDSRADMEVLAALFQEGPVSFSAAVDALGLPGAQHPEVDDFGRYSTAPNPNPISVLHASLWFRTHAFLGSDPGRALDDFERYRAASLPTVTVIAFFLRTTDEGMRAVTYLALALRGRLPPARLEAWVDEPSECQAWIANALRGHRLGYFVPLARDILEGRDVGERLGEGGSGPLGLRRLWEHGLRHAAPDDAALILEAYADQEQFFRTGVRGSGAPSAQELEHLGWPFALSTFEPGGFEMAICQVRVQERAARVLAFLAPGPGGIWPADDTEARRRLGTRARLLDAGPFALALRYERLEDGRVRVVADVAAPIPPSLDGTDVATQVFGFIPPATTAVPARPVASPGRAVPPPPPALRVGPFGVEVRPP
jgi:hypothetical protein